ncbi:MAG: hypothetical protein MPN21_27470 [Thermoanaerobaculia bacterium]|nr:hypothetical protein [Thermoanaerobaculia bacterium]
MERLKKSKELRAMAFQQENTLSDLRGRLETLKHEARPLGSPGAEFANEIHDIIGHLDEASGRISAAGRRLEGREFYSNDRQPLATSLVISDDVDLEPPDVRAVAVLLHAMEYAHDLGDWHGRLASEAAAWLVRQHPDLTRELRALSEESGSSGSVSFQAEMKP